MHGRSVSQSVQFNAKKRPLLFKQAEKVSPAFVVFAKYGIVFSINNKYNKSYNNFIRRCSY